MAPTQDVCVIVPTIRDHEFIRAYADNARANGFDLDRLFVVFVTEDFCDTEAMRRTLADAGLSGRVFDAAARTAWFEEMGLDTYADLIPAASHAQTSFGLLYLWANDFPFGVFLDDDTEPHPDFDFFGRHLSNLRHTGSIQRVASDTNWVNVLHQNVADHGLYPRGFPYSAMEESREIDAVDVDDVVASQGLWTDVPDLDAVRILQDGDLNGQATTRLTAADYDGSFVTARGDYLTVCSMNLAFEREVVPAFYQLPMDDNPWGVGRFDDIWSGVFLKRACDILDRHVVTGYPLCRHRKAPRSTFDDLAAEAPALALNEHLWRVVDDVGRRAGSFEEAYRAMADALVAGDWDDHRNGGFLNYVGEHMRRWLDCLAAISDTPEVAPPVDD